MVNQSLARPFRTLSSSPANQKLLKLKARRCNLPYSKGLVRHLFPHVLLLLIFDFNIILCFLVCLGVLVKYWSRIWIFHLQKVVSSHNAWLLNTVTLQSSWRYKTRLRFLDVQELQKPKQKHVPILLIMDITFLSFTLLPTSPPKN